MTSTESSPWRTRTLVVLLAIVVFFSVMWFVSLREEPNQEKDPRCLNIQDSINLATRTYLSGADYPDSESDRETLTSRLDSLDATGCTDQTATYVSISRMYASVQRGDYSDILNQTNHFLNQDTSYQRLTGALRSRREAKVRAYRASAYMALGDTVEATRSYQRVRNLRDYLTNELHRIQIDIYAHEAYAAIGDSSYLATAEIILIEAFEQLKDMQFKKGPTPYVNDLLRQTTEGLTNLYAKHGDFLFPMQFFRQNQEQASLVPILYASNVLVLCITLICIGILVLKKKKQHHEERVFNAIENLSKKNLDNNNR